MPYLLKLETLVAYNKELTDDYMNIISGAVTKK